VASRKSEWKITKISNIARKNIEALDSNSQKTLLSHFNELQKSPFHKDIKKVEGKKGIYRGRMGEVRYYFRIIVETNSIEILMVDFRGQIKRKSIQRLKN
jgi:mRNA-degrading endonuclease RelE of RelBE toxin-antitoxin system